ncbi:hypothetical protein D3C76_1343920 [compost metagenome]
MGIAAMLHPLHSLVQARLIVSKHPEQHTTAFQYSLGTLLLNVSCVHKYKVIMTGCSKQLQ